MVKVFDSMPPISRVATPVTPSSTNILPAAPSSRISWLKADSSYSMVPVASPEVATEP